MNWLIFTKNGAPQYYSIIAFRPFCFLKFAHAQCKCLESLAISKRRDLKHFNEANFLHGLSQLNWDVIQNYDDPNDIWRVWVDMLMNVVNKHAPIRETRIGKKRSPWITPNILQRMRSRDYFKKKFETTKDISTWNLYKKARNEVNNNLKQSKRDYFSTNLDLAKNDQKKTWNLINQLSSRNVSKRSTVNSRLTLMVQK